MPRTRPAFLAGLALLAVSAAGARATSAASSTSAPRLEIAADARPETVFRWAAQRCSDMNLPDSPARALRTRSGVMLMAAHFINIPLLGADFDHLAPSCAASSQGAEIADPTRFLDRFWVQALLPLPPAAPGRSGRVVGLASHEYMGWRHPGRCAAPFDGSGRRPAAFRCWYSAITAVVAEEGDWRFQTVKPTNGAADRGQVVAASPYPYNPAATARTGFFSVSNAVVEGDHAFALVYTEGVPGQPRGNCVLRTPVNEPVDGWQLLSRGDYAPRTDQGAASDARPCDVVGNAVFVGAPVRSVVRVAGTNGPWWIAVFTQAASRDAPAGTPEGVFYSRSRDLRAWLPAEQLWSMRPFRSQPEAGVYYEYPSLVDHASPSPIFDRVEEDLGRADLRLYLTRLNLINRKQGLNRDLVRVSVTVTP